jgi:hypothetical protein
MSPVIRISDETYARMERHVTFKHATPESVIIKALAALEMMDGDVPQQERVAAPKRNDGSKTPQRNFRLPLLITILEQGGTAPAKIVRERMEARLKGRLAVGDLDSVSTGDPRWWNAVCWERSDLVREGLMRGDSPRGIWEISEAGMKLSASLHQRSESGDKHVPGAGGTLAEVWAAYRSIGSKGDYVFTVTADDNGPLLFDESFPFNILLALKIDEMHLSIRAANSLKNDKLNYVGELVQKSEAELLRTPNMGRITLNEVKEALGNMGLHFGMELQTWPPANLEQLSDEAYDEYTKLLAAS